MDHAICEAIRLRQRLAFRYDGRERVVEPYCHGTTGTGAEALRAIQVAGESRSGPLPSRTGKLWRVDKMIALRLLEARFEPNDPHYHPDDKAMREIHCRI
jgi:hypothetical protein